MMPMVMVMVMEMDPDHEKRNMNLHFDSPVNNEIHITIKQRIILKRNGTFIQIFLKKNSYSTENSVSRQVPHCQMDTVFLQTIHVYHLNNSQDSLNRSCDYEYTCMALSTTK